MADLTPRQINILKHLVEEFIETAQPVGSEVMERKFNLGICPATIRNEMGRLAQMGYIKKQHSSSGRVPTSMGLKFYVKQLMEPEKLSVSEEIGIKDKLWEHRSDFSKMLSQATKELARRTRCWSVSATQQGDFFSSGVANLLDEPEFFDIDVTRTALSLMDQIDFWNKVMEDTFRAVGNEEFHVLIGSEMGAEYLEPCGFTYQDYEIGSRKGIIGILGPARQSYSEVVPLVNYFARVISEIGL